MVCVASLAVTAACGEAATEPAGGAPAEATAAGPSSKADAADASPKATAQGDPAVWVLRPNDGVQPSSTRFTALVTRLDCNGGVTGQVLAPAIRMGKSEVVVTFFVAPKQPGPAPCQGNAEVPYEVDLGEPLGDRALIDGQCLGEAAANTAFCVDGPARFKP